MNNLYRNLCTSSIASRQQSSFGLKTKLPKKQFTYLGNNLFKCSRYIYIQLCGSVRSCSLKHTAYPHPLHAPNLNSTHKYCSKRAFHSSKINVNIFEQFKFKFFSYFFYYSACARMKTNAPAKRARKKPPPAL